VEKYIEKHVDKHGDKKAYIIRNFTKLVETFGINRVTLTDVAQKSGLTKSGIYYYFDSKEALFLETWALIFSEVGTLMESELSKIENPEKKFYRFVELRSRIFSDPSLTLSFFSRCSMEIMNEMERFVFSSPEIVNKIMELHEFEKQNIKNMLKDLWGQQNYTEEFAEVVSQFLHTIFEGFMVMLKRIEQAPKEQQKCCLNAEIIPTMLAKILTYGIKNINNINGEKP